MTSVNNDAMSRSMKHSSQVAGSGLQPALKVSLLALGLAAGTALAADPRARGAAAPSPATDSPAATRSTAISPFVRDGAAGFVVSHIKFALGPDADQANTCPTGLTRTLQEIFAAQPGGKQRPGESDEEYGKRVDAGVKAINTLPGGENVCMNPELASPDPNYRTVQGTAVTVPGLDLDGIASDEDFINADGSPGVDNQFYRAVGCNRSFQSTGQSNGFDVEMLSGSWGIVISLEGVDDLRNDEEVIVHIAGNDDPIQLSPAREPLSYATYTMVQDPRFRATTAGRLVDGVLHTEPVDVRFYSVVNSMVLERPLQQAQIRATLAEDGQLSGYLAGYSPVEEMYDVNFGYRSGKTRHGELAPLGLRMGSSNGAAFVLGHTCNGVYHAMKQLADGLPDASGAYTAISTQYSFEALPAFVLQQQPDVAGAARQMAEQKHDK